MQPRTPEAARFSRLRLCWWTGLACAGLIGAAFFFWIMGASALAPSNLTWLLRGDLAQQAFGWLYFRTTPWSWPLGRISGYMEPFGSYLAFADTYPWFAVLAKLASPLLPAAAQITGLWLLTCFILQGVTGFLLLRELGLGTALAVVGAAFFVGSPVLVQRLDQGHATLCAQWLVVAALWLHARGSRTSLTPGLKRAWIGLTALAAATHPYLLVMVAALGASAHWEVWRRSDLPMRARRRGLVNFAAAMAAAVAVLGAFGYFTGSPSTWSGFDYFSSDVFGLLNPRDRSALVPGVLKVGQYEGFAWLGSGVVALAALWLGRRWRAQRSLAAGTTLAAGPRPLRSLTWVCLLLYAVSWGTNVRFFGQWWVDLAFLYNRFPSVTNALRVPGRFAWPLHYLVIAGVLGAVVKGTASRRVAALILGFALALQTADQLPFYAGKAARLTPEAGVAFRAPFWRTIGLHFRHLALIPPQLDDAHCSPTQAAEVPYTPHYAHNFLLLAWSQGMGINSGYNPRAPLAGFEAFCRELAAQLARGALDPDTLYVVDVKYREWWAATVGTAATCTVVDDLEVCATVGSKVAPDVSVRQK